MPDDRLRLIFTCCHPALGEGARIALTLRLLGGLTTGEIARAFLAGDATVAQRIVRGPRPRTALAPAWASVTVKGRAPPNRRGPALRRRPT